MQWLRWWHGTVNDPKFQWAARKAGCNLASVLAVWAVLLEHASQEDDRGSIAGFDGESYDCTLGLDDGTSERILAAFREKGLVDGDRVASWDGRQNKPDKSAERTQRWREKLKAQSEEEESKKDKIRLEGDSSRDVTVTSPTVTTKKANKGTGLPPGFVLTDVLSAYAAERLPKVDAPELFAAFRDHHTAKGTIAKDWDASWRTWVRNAQKFGYPMVTPAPAQSAPAKPIRYDSRGNVING